MSKLETLFNNAVSGLRDLAEYEENARKDVLAITEQVLAESPIQPVNIIQRMAILAMVNTAFDHGMESVEYTIGMLNVKDAMEKAMGITDSEFNDKPTIQ